MPKGYRLKLGKKLGERGKEFVG